MILRRVRRNDPAPVREAGTVYVVNSGEGNVSVLGPE